MNLKIPHSPFATRLSGSAREVELRLRNIFRWKKKRPPIILIVAAILIVACCGGLVGFYTEEPAPATVDTRYLFHFSGRNAEHEEFLAWEAEYAAAHQEEYDSFDGEAFFKANFTNPIERFSEDSDYDVQAYLAENPLRYGYGETFEERMRGCWLVPIWREELGRQAVEDAGYVDFPVPYWKMMCCDTLEEFLVGGQTYFYNSMTIEEYGEMVAWMMDYLARHPDEDAAFDAEAYQRDYLTYPYGELSKYNWFAYRPMDYSEEDYQLEIKSIWLRSLYDDWKGTASSPAADPTQEVLGYVDAIFASGDPELWCFLLPGTGPISAPMDEYYKEVRDLFAQYTWVRQDGPMPEREEDSRTMYLVSDGGIAIDIGTNCTWIAVMKGSEWIPYSAEDGADELGLSLVNLWDGPGFRYALVTLPESITDDNTLAQAYTDAFRELYLNSGAVADYELRDLEVLPRDNIYPRFLMTYAVKPTDPADPGWQYCPQAEDGWITITVNLCLTLAGYGYDNHGKVWRCSYWDYIL